MANRKNISEVWLIATAVVAIVGIALRFRRLGANSLWFDEGYTAWMVSHPLRQIVRLIRYDTAPPLYYMALRAWVLVFGDSEAGLRSMSALAGTITLGLVWLMARRALTTGAAQFAAVGLAAFSTLAVELSREARGYSLAAMLGMGALYAVC